MQYQVHVILKNFSKNPHTANQFLCTNNCPSNLTRESHLTHRYHIISSQSHLNHLNLSDLNGVNLRHLNLSHSNLCHPNLSHLNLTNLNLGHLNLSHPHPNLTLSCPNLRHLSYLGHLNLRHLNLPYLRLPTYSTLSCPNHFNLRHLSHAT